MCLLVIKYADFARVVQLLQVPTRNQQFVENAEFWKKREWKKWMKKSETGKHFRS